VNVGFSEAHPAGTFLIALGVVSMPLRNYRLLDSQFPPSYQTAPKLYIPTLNVDRGLALDGLELKIRALVRVHTWLPHSDKDCSSTLLGKDHS